MKLRNWHFTAGAVFACIVLLLFVRIDRTDRNSALTMEKTSALASLQTNIVRQSTVSESQGADVQGIADGTLFVSRTNQAFRLFKSVVPEIVYDRGLRKLEKPWYKTDAHEHARRYGADGKVTLKIVDAAGNAVPGASVVSGFHITDDRTLTVRATSDANGMAELASPCSGEMFFSVIKDGHYSTRLRYLFSQQGYDCVKDGRWQPWNPTIEVTLKEKRNPEPRPIKQVSLYLPEKEERFGFDCEIGDLVEPYGSGKTSDFDLACFSNASDEGYREYRFTNEVVMIGTSEDGGFIPLPSDSFSEFQTEYTARENGYQDEVLFSYRSGGGGARFVHESNPLKEGNYLVFRSRVSHGPTGDVVSANYGKILSSEFAYGYSLKKKAGGISFKYYYNPTPNDRNLEGSNVYQR